MIDYNLLIIVFIKFEELGLFLACNLYFGHKVNRFHCKNKFN